MIGWRNNRMWHVETAAFRDLMGRWPDGYWPTKSKTQLRERAFDLQKSRGFWEMRSESIGSKHLSIKRIFDVCEHPPWFPLTPS